MDATSRRSSPLAGVTLALAAGLAIVVPPEVHPESGPAIAALLLLGHLAARSPLALGPVVAAIALAALNAAATVAPGLFPDLFARFVLGAAAFALAWRVGDDGRRYALIAIAAGGALLALLALLQVTLILPADALAARASGLPEAFALRLESNRAFATHVVPAALGGALVIALAATAALMTATHASRAARWALAALALLLAAGLVTTSSIGAFASILAGLVPIAITRARALPRRTLVAALAALAIGASALVALRPGPVFDLSAPEHPLAQRIDNWRGALKLAGDAPAAGIGLGAFRSLYPSVRGAGDVATAYAHQSWIQLALEGGLPALALVVAALFALGRLARSPGDGAGPWLAGGVLAFAAHNLVDFTVYLPGVLVPAMSLAAFAFASARARASGAREIEAAEPIAPSAGAHHDDRAAAANRTRALAATALVAGALALAFAIMTTEALATRALERADARRAAGDIPQALDDAERAATLARHDARTSLDAARALLAIAPDDARALRAASAAIERAIVLDPESPAPWHAKGDFHFTRGEPALAWMAWSAARLRHPHDVPLGEKARRAERALVDAGLLAQPLEPPSALGRSSRAYPWEAWDDVLLFAGCLFAGVVAVRAAGSARRARAGEAGAATGVAPAAAIALGLALLLSVWGEGGALPGVRLGVVLVVAAGALAALLGRVRPGEGEALDDGAPALPWLLVPAAVLAALSAAISLEPAASRDGLLALFVPLAALALSYAIAARHPHWPRAAVAIVAAAAAAQGVLWLAQRVLVRAGVDVAALPVPLRADPAQPAADFLHPGHLGTLLVAAGLALAVSAALMRPLPRVRLAAGAALVALGLSGAARASAIALALGACALALLPFEPRVRRVLRAGLVVALVVGAAFLAHRFATRDDPYAWSRTAIWRASVDALIDEPWLGFGPGGFAARAPGYTRPDASEIARYGKTLRGPHSDLLGAFVALGLPGGLALVGALALLLLRALAHARDHAAREPEAAGAAVALAAIAGHALVDDLLTDRPAVALAAAVLLGAAAGRAPLGGAPLLPLAWSSRACRRTLPIAVVTAVAGAARTPWLADRLHRADRAAAAAHVDPARAALWIALANERAHEREPDPPQTIAEALDASARATLVAPGDASTWRTRARLLDVACRGPLSQRVVCVEARDAWKRAVALVPHDVFARRAIAHLERLLGGAEAARRELEIAVALEPDYLGAWIDLARLAREGSRDDDARAIEDRVRARILGLRGEDGLAGRDAALLRLTRDEWEAIGGGETRASPEAR